jgi:hypothetical protein
MAEARGGLAAAVLRGQIAVIGGEVFASGTRTLDSMEIYDPSQGAWAFGPATPVPVHGVPAAAVDGVLYLIGGSDQAGGIVNAGRVMAYVP